MEFLKDKWVWIKSILIPVILGGIVALLISGSMDYNDLNRPPLSPPGFIFGIVWTVLYTNGSILWNNSFKRLSK